MKHDTHQPSNQSNLPDDCSLSRPVERPTYVADEVAARLSEQMHPEVAIAYKILKQAGFKSFLFGGAVRDRALGGSPKDWDIATDAPASAVCSLFPEAAAISFEPGTFVLRKPEGGACVDIEITPISAKYGGSIEARLRADNEITFNSMAFDFNTRQVLDYFGGLNALERKSIEVRDPSKLRLDIVVRIARFVASYEAREEPFALDRKTLESAQSLVQHHPAILNAPELSTWKALRSLYYGFASVDVCRAFEWWERLGLLRAAFFPEFGDDKDMLLHAAGKVSLLPVEKRLGAFLHELPQSQVAEFKERTASYFLPPVRFLMMTEKMRRTLDPVIPRMCEIAPICHAPDAAQESRHIAQAREMEDMACAGATNAMFGEWLALPRSEQRHVLFQLKAPLAAHFIAEKTKLDLDNEPWTGYAIHWFKDLISVTDQPIRIMNTAFKVLVSDPNTDLRSLLLLYGYWGNMCCDRDILLQDPQRSKVAGMLKESAEDGSLLDVLKQSTLLRWFMINLSCEEFSRFAGPYAALLSEEHRARSGASFETFTWMTSEFGKVPEWADVILESLRDQHDEFCSEQQLPEDHVWRRYSPAWELAEDWGKTREGEYTRVTA